MDQPQLYLPRPHRWPRLNVKGLFALVALAACAIGIGLREVPYWQARHTFEYTKVSYEASVVTLPELVRAREKLFTIEQRRLFSTRRSAQANYIAWLSGLEERLRGRQPMMMFDSRQDREAFAEFIGGLHTRRSQLEQQLAKRGSQGRRP